MAKVGFAVPISPGKEDLATKRTIEELASAVPLLPGKAEALRGWAREAFGSRRQELTQSRLALRQTREEVFLSSSPGGDVAVAYLEGKDPIGANQEFAASAAPYDRWFKDNLKRFFPRS